MPKRTRDADAEALRTHTVDAYAHAVVDLMWIGELEHPTSSTVAMTNMRHVAFTLEACRRVSEVQYLQRVLFTLQAVHDGSIDDVSKTQSRQLALIVGAVAALIAAADDGSARTLVVGWLLLHGAWTRKRWLALLAPRTKCAARAELLAAAIVDEAPTAFTDALAAAGIEVGAQTTDVAAVRDSLMQRAQHLHEAAMA